MPRRRRHYRLTGKSVAVEQLNTAVAPNLKRVAPSAVCLGMYVQDLNMPWMEHGFLRARFWVTDEATLQRVRALDAAYVVVDASRDRGQPQLQPLRALAPTPAVDDPAAPSHPASKACATASRLSELRTQVQLEQELAIARKLAEEARRAITCAIEEGRTGRISNLSDIKTVAAEMVSSTRRHAGALQTLTLLKKADDYTFTHCVAVGTFMISLGRVLELDEDLLVEVGTAGLLHDVGKAGVDMKVLNKPGKLTDEEFRHIRLHPSIGREILLQSGFENNACLDVVHHHHERLDGLGYPEGLSGEAVSLMARMGAVTDVYDAVTSRRVYHRAMPPTAALKMMLDNANTQFDGKVVRAFVQAIGLYPNGSMVRLHSGKLALVREQNSAQPAQPKVRVFFSLKANLPMVPYDVDLSRSHDSITGYEDPVKWGITAARTATLLGVD